MVAPRHWLRHPRHWTGTPPIPPAIQAGGSGRDDTLNNYAVTTGGREYRPASDRCDLETGLAGVGSYLEHARAEEVIAVADMERT
jgi:hypothetical protein